MLIAAILYYAFPAQVIQDNSSQLAEQTSDKNSKISNVNSAKPPVKPFDISREKGPRDIAKVGMVDQ
jgi:hypothetical protein